MKIFGVRKRFYIPPLIGILILYLLAAISPNVEVEHVYNICPAFIFYTESGLKDGDAATARGMIVLIKPSYRNEPVCIPHELVHVKQAYRTFFMCSFISMFNSDYLAKLESEAYATEISNVESIKTYAAMIHDEYTPEVDSKIIEGYLKEFVKNG